MNANPAEPLTPRQRIAWELRQEGLRNRDIALRMGITRGRVCSILNAIKSRLRPKEPFWNDGLSFRARMILWNCDLNSREKVLQAFQAGQLQRWKGHAKPHNYGWVTYVEIARWLGLPDPVKPTPMIYVPNRCPHCGGILKGRTQSYELSS